MPPWSQVCCSADLVCSKQKGDSQRPTDRHVQSNMHSDKNCWTLRLDITNLKNNSGVAGTINLVILHWMRYYVFTHCDQVSGGSGENCVH